MSERFSTIIPAGHKGQRVDTALVACFPQFSRSQLSGWLKANYITINGASPLPKTKVKGNEQVELTVPSEPILVDAPEAIDLNIVYEDAAIIVINKPAGLIVHPGAGNPTGTVLNALLAHDASLAKLPRCGIVHRLDKDTTGLMVIAKTYEAQTSLVNQLQARSVSRIYEAVVKGVVRSSDVIDQPIGRHPVDRKRMAVRTGEQGKPAKTHYSIIQRYQHFTHVRIKLETGRTHQIRVHMASLQHPLVGDKTYGWRPQGQYVDFPRQALHAKALKLIHPSTEEEMGWQTDLPDDMNTLIEELNTHDAMD